MEGVARIFFNGYFFGGLFLGLAALYGFVSGAGILSTLSGFFYIIVVSLLSLNKTFRKSQFSILFCFYTFLYFNIPVAFILFEGSDYIFGGSIGALPFAQSDYKQSLPLGFLYLTVCWAAAWLGIISVNTSRRIINQREFSSIRLVPVLLLGVVVLAITWFDIRDYLDVRLSSGLQKVNSSLAFIFLITRI